MVIDKDIKVCFATVELGIEGFASFWSLGKVGKLLGCASLTVDG